MGWVADLGRLLEAGSDQHAGILDVDHVPVGAPFGALEHLQVPWTHSLSRQQVVDVVASRSYVITLPQEDRDRVLQSVRDLLQTHPDLSGRSDVDLPYVTHCYRTAKQ